MTRTDWSFKSQGAVNSDQSSALEPRACARAYQAPHGCQDRRFDPKFLTTVKLDNENDCP